MEQELFDRIISIADQLRANKKKLTLDSIITASLFKAGGTLAGYDKEVLQVIKMYTKKINEFDYTYKHNGNVETFTLNINKYGVMCLGYKVQGKKYYQCAMDRHPVEAKQLISILSKVETDSLMLSTFIPNNIEYYTKRGL